MRPREMMIARVHTASTSSRMCVEMTMILSRAMSLMSVRTSCFWLGSSPSVGSSRISTGGAWTIARAKALRERLDGLVEYPAELQVLDDVREALLTARTLERPQVGDEREDAAHGHLAVGRRPFGQITEGRLGRERLGLDVVTADAGAPGSRRDEPGQHAHGGGLARRVGTQESEHFTGPHLEAHILHRTECAVVFGQVFGLDHGSSRRLQSARFCPGRGAKFNCVEILLQYRAVKLVTSGGTEGRAARASSIRHGRVTFASTPAATLRPNAVAAQPRRGC